MIALDFLLTLVFICGARFAVRWAGRAARRAAPLLERAAHEVLIVGAGNGGQQVASELRRNPGLRSAPVGFVDDDPRKQGMRVAGHKVLGTTDELPRVLDAVKPDEVIIAIPSAPGILRQKVVTACRERDIPVRTLPTTFELLSGGVEPDAPGARGAGGGRARPRARARGDRPRRRLPARPGRARHRRRRARSAPSSAARSRACGPKLLVLVEHAENALFEIRRELEEERHFARAAAVLADCKDATRMREVFAGARARRSSSTPPPTSTCR